MGLVRKDCHHGIKGQFVLLCFYMGNMCQNFTAEIYKGSVCGTVSSMLSGLKTRSLGLNTLGTT